MKTKQNKIIILIIIIIIIIIIRLLLMCQIWSDYFRPFMISWKVTRCLHAPNLMCQKINIRKKNRFRRFPSGVWATQFKSARETRLSTDGQRDCPRTATLQRSNASTAIQQAAHRATRAARHTTAMDINVDEVLPLPLVYNDYVKTAINLALENEQHHPPQVAVGAAVMAAELA